MPPASPGRLASRTDWPSLRDGSLVRRRRDGPGGYARLRHRRGGRLAHRWTRSPGFSSGARRPQPRVRCGRGQVGPDPAKTPPLRRTPARWAVWSTPLASIGVSSWPAAGRKVRDALREKQRDALVSALVGARVVRNAHDLTGYLLLDVEMSSVSCSLPAQTGDRASVQLFVQRACLGLEPQTGFGCDPGDFGDDGNSEWEWMKHYRVWEANRKVFLYPENWLEPELRNDKTPLFPASWRAVCSRTTSRKKGCALAVREYVRKPDRLPVSRLRATCTETRQGVDILHAVGRTRSQPHKYFYRRRVCERWEPWEEVTGGIRANIC